MDTQEKQSLRITNTLAAPGVLAVGDWNLGEFATAWSEISVLHKYPQVPDLDQAIELLSHDTDPPELILLAQPLPGYYEQADLDRLQQLVPLTRLVIVAGSWCEGELRTGAPASGVVRLYWYELASWWQANIKRLNANRCPLWSLPLELPQSGRWDSEADRLSAAAPEIPVLINASDFAVFDALRAALEPYGLLGSWTRNQSNTSTSSATLGIWDGGQLDKQELTSLTAFCQRVDGPVVALLDFPRAEHVQQTRSAGAAQVFAKPYVVEELVDALTTGQAPS